MLESDSPDVTDRRRFLKLVGMAGLTSTLAGAPLALAQPTRSPGSKVAKPVPVPEPVAPAPRDDKPPEISEDAKTLAGIIERRYGKHLNTKQLEAVTRELNDRVQAGQRLRAVKFGNHDEPDFTFKA